MQLRMQYRVLNSDDIVSEPTHRLGAQKGWQSAMTVAQKHGTWKQDKVSEYRVSQLHFPSERLGASVALCKKTAQAQGLYPKLLLYSILSYRSIFNPLTLPYPSPTRNPQANDLAMPSATFSRRRIQQGHHAANVSDQIVPYLGRSAVQLFNSSLDLFQASPAISAASAVWKPRLPYGQQHYWQWRTMSHPDAKIEASERQKKTSSGRQLHCLSPYQPCTSTRKTMQRERVSELRSKNTLMPRAQLLKAGVNLNSCNRWLPALTSCWPRSVSTWIDTPWRVPVIGNGASSSAALMDRTKPTRKHYIGKDDQKEGHNDVNRDNVNLVRQLVS
ncbi:uncharacterized protein TRIVIDRAFT_203000 [Trichoderma virens Gv29-8]|uniref:Uncharacterized protein n=1 Tax=Hypocrea virens (strain Gv29-8 / FGSC 10586) TaxID=413071 RepID=G9MZ47_HYPVG|nr:uncharacterized protein TRIVIDRAFT_203000 [Trichoderma virens Gv29-8]EHK20374.1 hypothetical protein TRIVIDRAFT_203000 [Trichoderma virens Gv29-8]UKZ47034.1 hypothetical protein TrVGV298_001246 [Trichoderma virens]